MPEQQSGKVVVLSTMLNDHRQGDVIDRSQLVFHDPAGKADPHDAYDRLVASGAIRPVREGEEKLQRVPVATGGLSTEAQLKLGQLDATIEHLTRNVAAMQERLAFHQAQGVPAATVAPEEDPVVASAIAERVARVEHLAGQIEALQKSLGEAEKQTAAASEAKQKAAQEGRGGREMATGAAIPTDDAGKLTQQPAAARQGEGSAGGVASPHQPGSGGSHASPPGPASQPQQRRPRHDSGKE